MNQAIVRRARGLYSQHNLQNEVPDGALSIADNCVIDREGIVGKRRGWDLYGDSLSNAPTELSEYKSTILVLDGTTWKYDSDGEGTWASWSGSYTAPSGWNMKTHEVGGLFLFTTDKGVYSNDETSGTPVRSGVPEGLDMQVALSGAGSGWFTTDNQVAYRITFGREDANGRISIGEPTASHDITNPAAGTDDTVTITFTLHPDVVAGDFYEVWRTEMSGGENTAAGDICFHIIKNEISSTDITNGYVSFTDTYDETYLGERLYTNEGEEGISQTNSRPPLTKAGMATYEGHTFYANTTEPHQKELRLLGVTGLVDDTSSITITVIGGGSRTYTFSAAEDLANNKFQRHTTGLPSENVENTMRSLCKVINRDSSSSVFCTYISQTNDAPGIILLKARTLDTGQFSITANNTTTGSKFSPTIPTSGTTVSSSNNEKKNGLFRSKFEQPTAVPPSNYDSVGKYDSQILGIVALNESLLIWKEDGIFRLSGQTDGASGQSFTIEELDPTVKILAPDSLVAVNNMAHAFTTQGVVRADVNLSHIISRPIEPDLNETSEFEDFSTITRAVSYEKDRKYILLTQDTNADSYSKVMWTYNYITNAWTKWKKPVNCAKVMSDDRLYIGHAVKPYVLKERKSYSRSNIDYMDETVDCTITAVGTTTNSSGSTVSLLTVTFDWSETPSEGWYFRQNFYTSKVRSVTEISSTSFQLTLDDNLSSVTTGSAQLTVGIPSEVEWTPENAGNVTTMKQFTKLHIYLEKDFALRNYVGFQSDRQSAVEWSSLINITRSGGWGSGSWGSFSWGDASTLTATPLSINVPRNHQKCRAIRIRYKHLEAKERFDIQQVALVSREYTDIKISKAP